MYTDMAADICASFPPRRICDVYSYTKVIGTTSGIMGLLYMISLCHTQSKRLQHVLRSMCSFIDLILIMIPDRFIKYKTFELLIVFVAILQQFLHGS